MYGRRRVQWRPYALRPDWRRRVPRARRRRGRFAWCAGVDQERCLARMKLKLSFSYNVVLMAFAVLIRSSVYPSGDARATASAAILLLAPLRFSMTNDCPSCPDSD